MDIAYKHALACGVLAALCSLLSGCSSAPEASTTTTPIAIDVISPTTLQPTTTTSETTLPRLPFCASDNPFSCGKHYINPENAREYNKSISTATGITKANLQRMQKVPSAYWIDVKEKIEGTGTRTVEGILKDSASKSPTELVVFVWYNLPNRDCDAKASLGQICCTKNADGSCDFDTVSDCAEGIAEYKTGYVDRVVSVLQKYEDSVHIVLILEPDGLGNLATNLAHPHCGNKATQAAYKAGVTYAVQEITTKTPKVSLYLDAGHGGWLGWETNMQLFMKMLKGLDLPWQKIRGFAQNTANYQPLGVQCPWCPDSGYRNGYCLNGKHKADPCCDDPCDLATQFNSGHTELNYAAFLSAASIAELGFYPHMVIDTGRNGVPDMRASCSSWCNPRGAGAGIPSTTDTANTSLIDAYFWLKTPGESDGCSATLPSGEQCKRFDSGCGGADALGSKPGEERAPEAGGWYDFQVKQLAEHARFEEKVLVKPKFRESYGDATCPFELTPGLDRKNFNYTSSKGEHPCSGLFQQCGGAGWFGPGCCAGSCVCTTQDEYNSQCHPDVGESDCGKLTTETAFEETPSVRMTGGFLTGPVVIGAVFTIAAVGGIARARSWLMVGRQRAELSKSRDLGLGLYEDLRPDPQVASPDA